MVAVFFVRGNAVPGSPVDRPGEGTLVRRVAGLPGCRRGGSAPRRRPRWSSRAVPGTLRRPGRRHARRRPRDRRPALAGSPRRRPPGSIPRARTERTPGMPRGQGSLEEGFKVAGRPEVDGRRAEEYPGKDWFERDAPLEEAKVGRSASVRRGQCADRRRASGRARRRQRLAVLLGRRELRCLGAAPGRRRGTGRSGRRDGRASGHGPRTIDQLRERRVVAPDSVPRSKASAGGEAEPSTSPVPVAPGVAKGPSGTR